MRPTNKAMQNRSTIEPALIKNMEQCLRHLTTTTSRVNYVNDLLKANQRKQQSIQRRYHNISNGRVNEINKTIKPLLEEQGRVCDENELVINLVNEMGYRLTTCEAIITNLGLQFTTQLREQPARNTFESSIDRKSIKKTGINCYFCAKPNHVYTSCRAADQAQKNLIGGLLKQKKYDFVRFRERIDNRFRQAQRGFQPHSSKTTPATIDLSESTDDYESDSNQKKRTCEYWREPYSDMSDLDNDVSKNIATSASSSELPSGAKNNGAGSVTPTQDSIIDHPFETFTRFSKHKGFLEKVNF